MLSISYKYHKKGLFKSINSKTLSAEARPLWMMLYASETALAGFNIWEKIIINARDGSEKLIIEINNKFFQTSENRKKITEQKIVQMKEEAIKSIKDAAVKISIESATKLIKTSINKSKLDTLFKENLNQTKNTLKKTRA